MYDPDDLDPETEDCLITEIMRAALEAGSFELLLDAVAERDPDAADEIEDAMERHAARMRAAGEPGW